MEKCSAKLFSACDWWKAVVQAIWTPRKLWCVRYHWGYSAAPRNTSGISQSPQLSWGLSITCDHYHEKHHICPTHQPSRREVMAMDDMLDNLANSHPRTPWPSLLSWHREGA